MGRPKDGKYWDKVDREEDGRLKCKECGLKFKGGVSRIKAHIDRIEGKGIRVCSPPPNHITSSDHSHQHINLITTSREAERAGEMTDTAGGSINHPTVIGSTAAVVEGGLEVEMVGASVIPQNSTSLRDLLEDCFAEYDNGVLTTLQSQLNELVSDLTREKEEIQGQLQWMESNGKKRKIGVDDWLDQLQNMKQRAIDLKNKLSQFGFYDVYVQEEMYLAEEMQKHKKEKPLVLSNEFVGEEFEKNVKTMWKLLGDDRVLIIGIYGMGGVGKTFLATYMLNEIKRNKTFRDVFWVTVSHDFTIFKLQDHIAEVISVKLYGDGERTRATILASELETREKVVLILDDVWKYIDLEKVGIPLRVNGIKLIMISRLCHVFEQMDCLPNNMITIRPFDNNDYDDDDDDDDDDNNNDDECWELFLLKLGHRGTPSTLSPQVMDIARSVVRKCDGLPLGISVMARTMKGETNIHWWRHALNKLDKSEMEVEMKDEVLTVLRRSYDNLIEKDLQKCFLYCALLPDDGVERDDLITKLVKSGLLSGTRTVEEMLDEGNVTVDKLIKHSLLLLDDSGQLKMHGLVRIMAWNILKESDSNMMVKSNENMTEIPDIREWTIDLEAVCLVQNRIEKIGEGTSPNCPRLSTLLLYDNCISSIPDCFFTHMNALTTLDLSENKKLARLPRSLSNLRSLTSLVLNGCSELEYIPPLGELKSLLRLEISLCPILKVPPEGLENLINLEWLDLSYNSELKLVPGRFLPSLTKMQYLNLWCCSGIKVEDVHGMTMLECFAGTFVDRDNLNLYMQQILSSGYGPQTDLIYCGDSDLMKWMHYWDEVPLYSKLKCGKIWISVCKELSCVLQRDLAQLLVLYNDQWECFCAALLSNDPCPLKKIDIRGSTQLKTLFCSSCALCANIRSLQSLKLDDLESLTAICREDIPNLMQALPSISMFSHLKTFQIERCHRIKTLLTSSLVAQLKNLQSISVSYCDSMEEIFAVSYDDDDDDDDDDRMQARLPNLISLTLEHLPQLKTACKGILVCKSGFEARITYCPNLDEPRIEYVSV